MQIFIHTFNDDTNMNMIVSHYKFTHNPMGKPTLNITHLQSFILLFTFICCVTLLCASIYTYIHIYYRCV